MKELSYILIAILAVATASAFVLGQTGNPLSATDWNQVAGSPFDGSGGVEATKFSPDSRYFAFGGWGDSVFVYDTSDWQLVVEIHRSGLHPEDIAFSPDSGYMLVGTHFPSGEIYRTSDWSHLTSLDDPPSRSPEPTPYSDGRNEVEGVDWSPARIAIGTEGGRIYVYDSLTWDLETTLDLDTRVYHVAFSPGGRYLAAAHHVEGLEVYETGSWTLVEHFVPQTGSVAWSPNGDRLARGGKESVEVRGAGGDWNIIERIERNGNSGVDFSPDERFLAMASEKEDRAFVCETSGWSVVQEFAMPGGTVEDIDFSPNGEWLGFGAERNDPRAWVFEVPEQVVEYALEVSVVPEGAGTVSPPGGTYGEGTAVTLRASPENRFVEWRGSASGTSPTVTMIMDSDKRVTAVFEELPAEPEENWAEKNKLKIVVAAAVVLLAYVAIRGERWWT